ncbi:uncharacterized protein LOC122129488 isoform X2 [Clupea harengus]|uniref:Uncharacterized protein LOC122129488 isoform X2 n=1 Tax=Clupea harengus TaxID=7950 RepID=A0A8M1K8Y8_CLUHA|nr:uncharacterized protein LOC122129488 isoform X2 [Clupea harengus]
MNATAAEGLLVEFLEELSLKELHTFQTILQQQHCPEKKGEKEDARSVVQFLMNKSGSAEAVNIAVSILEEIKLNQLALQLRECYDKEKDQSFRDKESFPSEESTELFKPDVRDVMETPAHRSHYSFNFKHAGMFQCCFTGLVFKMTSAGLVEYHHVPWDQKGQGVAAGPLYDIECPDGSLCQLGLPHCDVVSARSNESLSVIHASLKKPVESLKPLLMSDSHLFVDISTCSKFGIQTSLPLTPQKVLVKLSLQGSTLNVMLLPRNAILREVREWRQRMIAPETEIFIETGFYCSLTPGERYTLSCEGAAAGGIDPQEAEFSLQYDSYQPTFRVSLANRREVQLGLRENAADQQVWDCHVKLPDTELLEGDELSEYNFSSGYPVECLIINNVRFPNGERKGSDIDAAALHNVFNWLGFRVTIMEDLGAAEMRQRLGMISQSVRGHCFVCCVLSHGNEKGVFGIDHEIITVKEINSLFSPQNCPALANKPKVFFFQACRGGQRDHVLQVPAARAEVQVDAGEIDVPDRVIISTPAHSDILNCLSTVEDYVSIRSRTKGSWFIQSVCKQLRHGCTRNDDILTVLTRVNAEVSGLEGRIGRNTVKQIPEERHTMRKKLYFRVPKHVE